MQTLKKITGYTLAALATPLVLATFMGLEIWPAKLAHATGVKVSAWYTGGEVVRTIPRQGYEVRVHRPVFDGFLWEASEGFVQIDWAPRESVPPLVAEDIDFNNDSATDFRVELDSGNVTAKLTDRTGRVIGVERAYKLRRSYAVRVLLRNQ